MNTNPNVLLDTLKVYYNTKRNREMFLNVILHRSPISLRLLDFLCTKYAKIKNCEFTLDGKKINIYNQYRSQLRSYSKKNLDPFCRRQRYEFTILDDVIGADLTVITTIGQLNFFRWAIHSKIIEYAQDHMHEIEEAMNKTPKKARSQSKNELNQTLNKDRSFKIHFE